MVCDATKAPFADESASPEDECHALMVQPTFTRDKLRDSADTLILSVQQSAPTFGASER